MALREDLELDVTGALASVDRVASQLTTVATSFRSDLAESLDVLTDESVRVTADTAGLSSEVEGAVEAADSTIRVNGETRDLTGDIAAGIDAADATVTPTADTAGLTREIEDAIDAVDAEIDVDAGEATEQLDGLGASAFAAGGALSRLSPRALAIGGGGLVAALGLRELVEGLNESAQLAVSLGESINRSEVIFGDAADEITRLTEGSVRNLALAEDQVINAAGAFGVLLSQADVSEQQLAEMSASLVRIAVDVSSLSNIPVPVVLERLESGLVGETESLRRLGIVFDEAALQAKGLELGLADASGEIAVQDKLLARYALIVERSGFAAGDYANTIDSVANRQQQLTAAIRDARIAFGKELLPVMPDLIGAVEDLIPPITDLAIELVPALVAGAEIAVPVVGLLADALGVLTGAIDAVQTALDVPRSIGEGIREWLNDFDFEGVNLLGIGEGVSVLGDETEDTTGAVEDLAGAADQELGPAAAALQQILEGLSGATAGVGQETESAAEKMGDAASLMRSISEDVFGLPRAELDFADSLADLRGLDDAGTGAARGISAAERALAEFVPEVVSAEDVLESFTSAVDELLGREFGLEGATDEFTQQMRQFAQRSRQEGFQPILEGTSEAAVTNREAFRRLVESGAEVVEAAREQGVTGEELNQVVDEQEAKILALADALGFSEEETDRYVSVLEDLIPATERSERALRDRIAAENAQQRAELRAKVATEQATRAIDDQTQPARDTATALFDLAENAADVVIEMIEAEEPIDKVAAKFDELKGIVFDVAGQLDAAPSTVEDLREFFENVSGVIGVEALKSGQSVSIQFLQGLISGLLDDTQREQLDKLIRFTGLSVIDALEKVLGIASPSTEAIRIGEQFVEGLIAGLDPGDVADLAGPFEDALQGILNQLGRIGPRAQLAATRLREEIADLLSAASGIGDTLSLEDLLGVIAGDGLDAGTFGFDALFAQFDVLGERAGRGFRAVDETLEEVRRRRAFELGAEARQAERDAIDAIDDLGAAIAGLDLEGLLDEQGRVAGEALVQGLREALSGGERSLVQTVAEIATDVIDEFRTELGIASPSSLTRQIGEDLVAGLAQGLGADLAAVTAAGNLSRRVSSGITPAIPSQNAPGGPLTAVLDNGTLSPLLAALGSVQQPLIGQQIVNGRGGAAETASQILRRLRSASFREGRGA